MVAMKMYPPVDGDRRPVGYHHRSQFNRHGPKRDTVRLTSIDDHLPESRSVHGIQHAVAIGTVEKRPMVGSESESDFDSTAPNGIQEIVVYTFASNTPRSFPRSQTC